MSNRCAPAKLARLQESVGLSPGPGPGPAWIRIQALFANHTRGNAASGTFAGVSGAACHEAAGTSKWICEGWPTLAGRCAAAAGRRIPWEQVVLFRALRHRLDRRAPRRAMLRVAGEICGLHAQVLSSAELSLWARAVA